MVDGPSVVQALTRCGVTHVVWIPDSEFGQWESALSASQALRLIRVSREGEAIALAAGLMLGGKHPVVVMQCTGFFEAGDALRNVVHDLRLPLFLIVGIRGYLAHQQKKTLDNCPIFVEPIMQAWRLPYRLLGESANADEIAEAYRECQQSVHAQAILIRE